MAEEEQKEDTDIPKTDGLRRHRLSFWVFCVVLALPCLAACVWFALPYLLSFVSFPDISVDLSQNMKDTPPGLFPDQTLTLKYGVGRKAGGGYRMTGKGRVLGWPFTASAEIDLVPKFLGLDARGKADIRLDGSMLGVSATFSASAPGGWRVDVEMPETPLSNNDPFLKSILSRHQEEAVRKAVFDGLASLAAHAEQVGICGGPPRWEAKVRITGLDASTDAGTGPVRMENFRVGVGASGLADHIDIAPMFPHADCVEGAGCSLSNVFASVRATETAFLVTEAGADFCDGEVRLYAMFLDTKKLDAGVTIYMDDIDAGQALAHINGFKGEATGTLNGKLPLRLKNGRELHFGKCYLHSVPGEKGNLKVFDAKPITDNLAMGGVPKETTDNLANALADLDYSALKIGLVPEGEDSMALSMKLEGSASRDGTEVPVSFAVTFHGQLDQLINTGLRVATRKDKLIQ